MSLLSIAASLSLTLLTPPPVAPGRAGASMPTASAAASGLDRRALLSSAAAAAAGLAAIGPLAPPAWAESTLVTRQQAYTRYVPRIERGRDFWAGGLRKMISTQDWAGIARELEPVGKNKGGAIAKVFGPMRLWASSWSSKTVSEKTLAMNDAIDELAEAASSLQIAATGKEKSDGFFSFLGGQKTMDEANRIKLAQVAYKKGVSAFNKYIVIGNDGLGLSFAPIDTID